MAGNCRCLFQHSISGKTFHNYLSLIQDSSWVRVAARKRCQEQSCLFRPGHYRNKGHNPENKHDKRTAPKTKLSASAGRLEEQRPQPRKYVLGSSPGEGGFCSLETKHNKRAAPRIKFSASAGRLQEQRPQSRKFVPGSSPGEDGFCSSVTKRDRRTALCICKHL
jgi:hypothetical protein